MKTARTAFLLFTFLFISTLRAETADEIISKHIAAIGGADAWHKVNSFIFDGSISANGAEISVKASIIIGKAMRMDISVMGMTGYTIITKDSGWMYMPFNGQQKPDAMTPEMVKESQDQLEMNNDLIDYKAKGHTVEYLGKEDVEGTECYKIKLTRKNGKVKTIFIDPANYYVIREVEKHKANGQEFDNTTDFSNYQKLPEGITVPMSIGGSNGAVTVKKYQVNAKIDESIFKVG